MAHAIERPEQYVCLNCQVIYAASVTGQEDTHHFNPPSDCAVCGDPEFVQIESYIPRALNRGESA